MTRLPRIAGLFSALMLLGGGGTYAQHAPAPYRLGDAVMEARQMVHASMADSAVPGLALAVMVDGQIIWSEGFGYADLEQRVPMWPTSKVRVGSVSKPFTAAAAMRLWDRGLLDLDAEVQQYVPYFPSKRWPLTTRQLGGHLGGIRHYVGTEFLSAQPYPTVEDGISMFSADTLMHEPGSHFLYSSHGWNLISAAIEGAAGSSFLKIMRTEVFEPLGLIHTVADHPDSLITQRVRFYDLGEHGGFVNAPYVDNSYKWAGGGFLSSVEDIARFADAHLHGSYLSEDARNILFTSQQTADGEATGYGFGWRTGNMEGFRYVGHGGGSVGGSTMMLALPEVRLVIASHVNLTGNSMESLTAQIALLFADALTQ